MASRVLETLTCHNLFVDVVSVNGFAEEKQKNKERLEYVFAVEVYWSDGRMCCVRRTYKDFLELYSLLVNETKSLKETEYCMSSIPRLQGWKWFRRYDRILAESRELELHQFVQELLHRNPQIASHPIVLDFFEQRPTDPFQSTLKSNRNVAIYDNAHRMDKQYECNIL
ncbi:hypothetical protein SNE40_012749 [Patella caerulea]|uniref:PX domain-containing protein n=1 Tax=Patella caerulea TaxID=87958 RepID=A0AAN8JN48_PATCE